MIETMDNLKGRMGVIVPHGVLFRGGSEGQIRQQLIEENLLSAVIGLPVNLFFGTGIPAAILIFKRNKANDSQNEANTSFGLLTILLQTIKKIVGGSSDGFGQRKPDRF